MPYFSHLPPREAIARCSRLNGAEEICSDVDNWKAYIIRRYGLKFSLQRPDLTTADEWQRQALALEISTDSEADENVYLAMALFDGTTRLMNLEQRREYYREPTNRGAAFFTPIIYVPGIPIVISAETRQMTFHVGRFTSTILIGQTLTSIFESVALTEQWFLELLIPAYSEYVDEGRLLTALQFDAVDRTGHVTSRRIQGTANKAENLNLVLSTFKELLGTSGTSFNLSVQFSRTMIAGPTNIRLTYVPAKLF